MKTKILLNLFAAIGVIFGLAITAHAQNLYVSVNGPLGSGNSDGSISEYTPAGAATVFASEIPRPRGVIFDSGGNLYAATTSSVDDHYVCKPVTFNARRKATPIGAVSFEFLEGIAMDAAGNVYAMAGSTIFKFVPGISRSVFGTIPDVGFGLAFDGAGNLYAADVGSDTAAPTIYKFAPDGTRTVFVGPSAFAPDTFPVGLTFDSSGNLFVSTEGDPGNDTILEFTPSGMVSTFATGLTQPRGLAFDSAGNLFVAETLPAPLGDILRFSPGGGGPTVFATGIARPEFLAFGPPR
jgi:DNA-binding beta-propeller fold protein YncE